MQLSLSEEFEVKPYYDDNTRYLIEYRGQRFECWKECGKFITDGYSWLDSNKVIVVKRLGTPEEVFDDK